MTTEQVRDQIAGQFPSWAYTGGGRSFDFTISLLPGFNALPCQLWQGATLEEALAKFDAAKPAVAQPSTVEAE